MSEMKRINITIWDFLDKDIRELNKTTLNVSQICRRSLETEVLVRKLVDTDPDTWKKHHERTKQVFDTDKHTLGFQAAKSHMEGVQLHPSIIYYMYKEFKQLLDTSLSSICWYNLCKSNASSESVVNLMFSASGQDKNEDLPIYAEEDEDGNPIEIQYPYEPIDNLYQYFQDVFDAQSELSEEEAEDYRSYDGNTAWLEGYYHYVYLYILFMSHSFAHDQKQTGKTLSALFDEE